MTNSKKLLFSGFLNIFFPLDTQRCLRSVKHFRYFLSSSKPKCDLNPSTGVLSGECSVTITSPTHTPGPKGRQREHWQFLLSSGKTHPIINPTSPSLGSPEEECRETNLLERAVSSFNFSREGGVGKAKSCHTPGV